MRFKIEKPIFIVGSGRSGTTIFYETLSCHKDVAWISNYSNRFYENFPISAAACRFYILNPKTKEFYKKSPKPIEGYNLWNWCHPVENSPYDPPLDENDAINKEIVMRSRKMVSDHLRFSIKNRFVNKNTRNSRRIRYLNAIFPDAKFLHIFRDGRPVIASLITVRERLTPWYKKQKQENNRWLDTRENKIMLAAELWMKEVKKILNDKKYLKKSQYFEVRYENFVKKPVDIIRDACNFCELEWTYEYEKLVKSKAIYDKNSYYKKRLSDCEIMKVEDIIREFSYSLNYII